MEAILHGCCNDCSNIKFIYIDGHIEESAKCFPYKPNSMRYVNESVLQLYHSNYKKAFFVQHINLNYNIYNDTSYSNRTYNNDFLLEVSNMMLLRYKNTNSSYGGYIGIDICSLIEKKNRYVKQISLGVEYNCAIKDNFLFMTCGHLFVPVYNYTTASNAIVSGHDLTKYNKVRYYDDRIVSFQLYNNQDIYTVETTAALSIGFRYKNFVQVVWDQSICIDTAFWANSWKSSLSSRFMLNNGFYFIIGFEYNKSFFVRTSIGYGISFGGNKNFDMEDENPSEDLLESYVGIHRPNIFCLFQNTKTINCAIHSMDATFWTLHTNEWTVEQLLECINKRQFHGYNVILLPPTTTLKLQIPDNGNDQMPPAITLPDLPIIFAGKIKVDMMLDGNQLSSFYLGEEGKVYLENPIDLSGNQPKIFEGVLVDATKAKTMFSLKTDGDTDKQSKDILSTDSLDSTVVSIDLHNVTRQSTDTTPIITESGYPVQINILHEQDTDAIYYLGSGLSGYINFNGRSIRLINTSLTQDEIDRYNDFIITGEEILVEDTLLINKNISLFSEQNSTKCIPQIVIGSDKVYKPVLSSSGNIGAMFRSSSMGKIEVLGINIANKAWVFWSVSSSAHTAMICEDVEFINHTHIIHIVDATFTIKLNNDETKMFTNRLDGVKLEEPTHVYLYRDCSILHSNYVDTDTVYISNMNKDRVLLSTGFVNYNTHPLEILVDEINETPTIHGDLYQPPWLVIRKSKAKVYVKNLSISVHEPLIQVLKDADDTMISFSDNNIIKSIGIQILSTVGSLYLSDINSYTYVVGAEGFNKIIQEGIPNHDINSNSYILLGEDVVVNKQCNIKGKVNIIGDGYIQIPIEQTTLDRDVYYAVSLGRQGYKRSMFVEQTKPFVMQKNSYLNIAGAGIYSDIDKIQLICEDGSLDNQSIVDLSSSYFYSKSTPYFVIKNGMQVILPPDGVKVISNCGSDINIQLNGKIEYVVFSDIYPYSVINIEKDVVVLASSASHTIKTADMKWVITGKDIDEYMPSTVYSQENVSFVVTHPATVTWVGGEFVCPTIQDSMFDIRTSGCVLDFTEVNIMNDLYIDTINGVSIHVSDEESIYTLDGFLEGKVFNGGSFFVCNDIYLRDSIKVSMQKDITFYGLPSSYIKIPLKTRPSKNLYVKGARDNNKYKIDSSGFVDSAPMLLIDNQEHECNLKISDGIQLITGDNPLMDINADVKLYVDLSEAQLEEQNKINIGGRVELKIAPAVKIITSTIESDLVDNTQMLDRCNYFILKDDIRLHKTVHIYTPITISGSTNNIISFKNNTDQSINVNIVVKDTQCASKISASPELDKAFYFWEETGVLTFYNVHIDQSISMIVPATVYGIFNAEYSYGKAQLLIDGYLLVNIHNHQACIGSHPKAFISNDSLKDVEYLIVNHNTSLAPNNIYDINQPLQVMGIDNTKQVLINIQDIELMIQPLTHYAHQASLIIPNSVEFNIIRPINNMSWKNFSLNMDKLIIKVPDDIEYYALEFNLSNITAIKSCDILCTSGMTHIDYDNTLVHILSSGVYYEETLSGYIILGSITISNNININGNVDIKHSMAVGLDNTITFRSKDKEQEKHGDIYAYIKDHQPLIHINTPNIQFQIDKELVVSLHDISESATTNNLQSDNNVVFNIGSKAENFILHVETLLISELNNEDNSKYGYKCIVDGQGIIYFPDNLILCRIHEPTFFVDFWKTQIPKLEKAKVLCLSHSPILFTDSLEVSTTNVSLLWFSSQFDIDNVSVVLCEDSTIKHGYIHIQSPYVKHTQIVSKNSNYLFDILVVNKHDFKLQLGSIEIPCLLYNSSSDQTFKICNFRSREPEAIYSNIDIDLSNICSDKQYNYMVEFSADISNIYGYISLPGKKLYIGMQQNNILCSPQHMIGIEDITMILTGGVIDCSGPDNHLKIGVNGKLSIIGLSGSGTTKTSTSIVHNMGSLSLSFMKGVITPRCKISNQWIEFLSKKLEVKITNVEILCVNEEATEANKWISFGTPGFEGNICLQDLIVLPGYDHRHKLIVDVENVNHLSLIVQNEDAILFPKICYTNQISHDNNSTHIIYYLQETTVLREPIFLTNKDKIYIKSAKDSMDQGYSISGAMLYLSSPKDVNQSILTVEPPGQIRCGSRNSLSVPYCSLDGIDLKIADPTYPLIMLDGKEGLSIIKYHRPDIYIDNEVTDHEPLPFTIKVSEYNQQASLMFLINKGRGKAGALFINSNNADGAFCDQETISMLEEYSTEQNIGFRNMSVVVFWMPGTHELKIRPSQNYNLVDSVMWTYNNMNKQNKISLHGCNISVVQSIGIKESKLILKDLITDQPKALEIPMGSTCVIQGVKVADLKLKVKDMGVGSWDTLTKISIDSSSISALLQDQGDMRLTFDKGSVLFLETNRSNETKSYLIVAGENLFHDCSKLFSNRTYLPVTVAFKDNIYNFTQQWHSSWKMPNHIRLKSWIPLDNNYRIHIRLGPELEVDKKDDHSYLLQKGKLWFGAEHTELEADIYGSKELIHIALDGYVSIKNSKLYSTHGPIAEITIMNSEDLFNRTLEINNCDLLLLDSRKGSIIHVVGDTPYNDQIELNCVCGDNNMYICINDVIDSNIESYGRIIPFIKFGELTDENREPRGFSKVKLSSNLVKFNYVSFDNNLYTSMLQDGYQGVIQDDTNHIYSIDPTLNDNKTAHSIALMLFDKPNIPLSVLYVDQKNITVPVIIKAKTALLWSIDHKEYNLSLVTYPSGAILPQDMNKLSVFCYNYVVMNVKKSQLKLSSKSINIDVIKAELNSSGKAKSIYYHDGQTDIYSEVLCYQPHQEYFSGKFSLSVGAISNCYVDKSKYANSAIPEVATIWVIAADMYNNVFSITGPTTNVDVQDIGYVKIITGVEWDYNDPLNTPDFEHHMNSSKNFYKNEVSRPLFIDIKTLDTVILHINDTVYNLDLQLCPHGITCIYMTDKYAMDINPKKQCCCICDVDDIGHVTRVFNDITFLMVMDNPSSTIKGQTIYVPENGNMMVCCGLSPSRSAFYIYPQEGTKYMMNILSGKARGTYSVDPNNIKLWKEKLIDRYSGAPSMFNSNKIQLSPEGPFCYCSRSSTLVLHGIFIIPENTVLAYMDYGATLIAVEYLSSNRPRIDINCAPQASLNMYKDQHISIYPWDDDYEPFYDFRNKKLIEYCIKHAKAPMDKSLAYCNVDTTQNNYYVLHNDTVFETSITFNTNNIVGGIFGKESGLDHMLITLDHIKDVNGHFRQRFKKESKCAFAEYKWIILKSQELETTFFGIEADNVIFGIQDIKFMLYTPPYTEDLKSSPSLINAKYNILEACRHKGNNFIFDMGQVSGKGGHLFYDTANLLVNTSGKVLFTNHKGQPSIVHCIATMDPVPELFNNNAYEDTIVLFVASPPIYILKTPLHITIEDNVTYKLCGVYAKEKDLHLGLVVIKSMNNNNWSPTMIEAGSLQGGFSITMHTHSRLYLANLYIDALCTPDTPMVTLDSSHLNESTNIIIGREYTWKVYVEMVTMNVTYKVDLDTDFKDAQGVKYCSGIFHLIYNNQYATQTLFDFKHSSILVEAPINSMGTIPMTSLFFTETPQEQLANIEDTLLLKSMILSVRIYDFDINNIDNVSLFSIRSKSILPPYNRAWNITWDIASVGSLVMGSTDEAILPLVRSIGDNIKTTLRFNSPYGMGNGKMFPIDVGIECIGKSSIFVWYNLQNNLQTLFCTIGNVLHIPTFERLTSLCIIYQDNTDWILRTPFSIDKHLSILSNIDVVNKHKVNIGKDNVYMWMGGANTPTPFIDRNRCGTIYLPSHGLVKYTGLHDDVYLKVTGKVSVSTNIECPLAIIESPKNAVIVLVDTDLLLTGKAYIDFRLGQGQVWFKDNMSLTVSSDLSSWSLPTSSGGLVTAVPNTLTLTGTDFECSDRWFLGTQAHIISDLEGQLIIYADRSYKGRVNIVCMPKIFLKNSGEICLSGNISLSDGTTSGLNIYPQCDDVEKRPIINMKDVICDGDNPVISIHRHVPYGDSPQYPYFPTLIGTGQENDFLVWHTDDLVHLVEQDSDKPKHIYMLLSLVLPRNKDFIKVAGNVYLYGRPPNSTIIHDSRDGDQEIPIKLSIEDGKTHIHVYRDNIYYRHSDGNQYDFPQYLTSMRHLSDGPKNGMDNYGSEATLGNGIEEYFYFMGYVTKYPLKIQGQHPVCLTLAKNDLSTTSNMNELGAYFLLSPGSYLHVNTNDLYIISEGIWCKSEGAIDLQDPGWMVYVEGYYAPCNIAVLDTYVSSYNIYTPWVSNSDDSELATGETSHILGWDGSIQQIDFIKIYDSLKPEAKPGAVLICQKPTADTYTNLRMAQVYLQGRGCYRVWYNVFDFIVPTAEIHIQNLSTGTSAAYHQARREVISAKIDRENSIVLV